MLKRAFVTAALFAFTLPALGQSSGQLVERYTGLAGSKENATSLVTGLRDGKEVRLTNAQGSETFTPSTGKMGYGNVDHALALAEASLRQQGITNPTPAQLEAALMGGKITLASGKTVELQGVLQMRASGMGWGQIANSMGFKLGDVKRADKAADRVARSERPAKPEKPQRPEKPERPEKPGK
jgi:hypothetical protein